MRGSQGRGGGRRLQSRRQRLLVSALILAAVLASWAVLNRLDSTSSAAAFLGGLCLQNHQKSRSGGRLAAGPTSWPLGEGRKAQLGKLSRAAGERAAYIAVVDVDVAKGSEDNFLQASLANARESVREESNQRFDVLQSTTEPNRFALVEIYRKQQGPVDHKATAHYQTWREEVESMMASPRSATQWDTIFPSVASEFAPKALILERAEPAYFNITHVFVDVNPGSEDAFIEATLDNAKASVREAENMRFDFLRGVDDPTKFLLVEVYRSDLGAEEHKETEHYLAWREAVADMMASPRVAKKYRNHFPNLPAGWQGDGDLLQAGGQNWAR